MRFFLALLLLPALAFAQTTTTASTSSTSSSVTTTSSSSTVTTTTATTSTTSTTLAVNDAALTWTVTGTVTDVPTTLAFNCTIPAGGGVCDIGRDDVGIRFAGSSTTALTMSIDPVTICQNAGKCSLVDASTDVEPAAVTATLTACHYTASATTMIHFSNRCARCFANTIPQFTITWSAVSSAAC